MKQELPLAKPFQQPQERAMIWLSFSALLLITLFASHLGVRRETLIATLPPSEANAPFLIDQIYHQTSDIDVAIIGNCTVWWQFYTPELKAQLQQKHLRPFTVLTFGYNHYGSDLPYLIFKDLLERRKVNYLILPLPKIEDHYVFPHKSAIQWWIYPADITSGLSALAHVKLFGLSFFTSLRREVQALLKKEKTIPAPGKSVAADLDGFNLQRVDERDPQQTFSAQGFYPLKVAAISEPLADRKRDPSPLLRGEWELFYKKIAILAKEHHVQVIFIDSPHAMEFESEDETVTWGFEGFFPSETRLVSLDFKAWKESLPQEFSSRLLMGHNLTYLGARLFSATLTPSLTEIIQP